VNHITLSAAGFIIGWVTCAL